MNEQHGNRLDKVYYGNTPRPVIATGRYTGKQKEFISMADIAREFGCSSIQISRYIRSGKELNGYFLKHKENYE